MFVYFRFERVIDWLSGSCGRCFGAKWEILQDAGGVFT